MRTQKHKILSIIVLNMAKYTIISLILIDFVPIFVTVNLFRNFFRGSFLFKKSQVQKSSKLILGGGGANPVQKSPNPAGGVIIFIFHVQPTLGDMSASKHSDVF